MKNLAIAPPLIKHYSFPRKKGTMPGTLKLLEDDARVIHNIADERVRKKLDASLTAGLQTGLSGYIGSVMDYYAAAVKSGSIKKREHLEEIAALVVRSVGDYWGLNLSTPVEVVLVENMLEAENKAGGRLMSAIGSTSPKLSLPSPCFFDNLERKIVLSDHYTFTYPDKTTVFYDWDEGILKTIIANEAGKYAVRTLRGETGKDYVQMLRALGVVVPALQHTVAAANTYANTRILRDVGVPVLYRRILDALLVPDQVQILNMTMKTLGDELGIKTAALFDFVNCVPGSGYIDGYLFGNHSNYERKDAAIMDAVQKLQPRPSVASVSLAFFRQKYAFSLN